MTDRLDIDQIREFLEKGYLHCRATFTMIGKPKEHLEETLSNYTKKLFEDKGFEAVQVDLFEAKEIEESDLLQAFVEFEFLVESISKLNDFMFNYLPGTIEVIEPTKRDLTNFDMTNLYQELALKLHRIDTVMKQTILEKNKLEKELSAK